jgi:hypothetical protein
MNIDISETAEKEKKVGLNGEFLKMSVHAKFTHHRLSNVNTCITTKKRQAWV